MVKKHELHAGETDKRPIPRCMLYRGGASKVFTGEDAIEAALEDGWSDAPAEQTAQADDSAATVDERVEELEGFLAAASDAADDANKRAEEAEGKLAAETKRANAAEKLLAAAKKKATGNARK